MQYKHYLCNVRIQTSMTVHVTPTHRLHAFSSNQSLASPPRSIVNMDKVVLADASDDLPPDLEASEGGGVGGGDSFASSSNGPSITSASPLVPSHGPPGSYATGPYHYSYRTLKQNGVIAKAHVAKHYLRQVHVYFMSPLPGTFRLSVYYKSRANPILHQDVQLDELLALEQRHHDLLQRHAGLSPDTTTDDVAHLHATFFQWDGRKLLALLQKLFLKKPKSIR